MIKLTDDHWYEIKSAMRNAALNTGQDVLFTEKARNMVREACQNAMREYLKEEKYKGSIDDLMRSKEAQDLMLEASNTLRVIHKEQ